MLPPCVYCYAPYPLCVCVSYSQAVLVDKTLYLAGQIGLNPEVSDAWQILCWAQYSYVSCRDAVGCVINYWSLFRPWNLQLQMQLDKPNRYTGAAQTMNIALWGPACWVSIRPCLFSVVACECLSLKILLNMGAVLEAGGSSFDKGTCTRAAFGGRERETFTPLGELLPPPRL